METAMILSGVYVVAAVVVCIGLCRQAAWADEYDGGIEKEIELPLLALTYTPYASTVAVR